MRCSNAHQERAFEVVGKPLLEAALQGIDASCVCYGQVSVALQSERRPVEANKRTVLLL